MAKPYTSYLAPSITDTNGGSVADGDYIFSLVDNDVDIPNIVAIYSYFYFVDGNDDVVTATGGTVVITASPDRGKTYLTLPEGAFDAADANLPTRLRPSGLGVMTHVKVTLAGVTGPGVGFEGQFLQATST